MKPKDQAVPQESLSIGPGQSTIEIHGPQGLVEINVPIRWQMQDLTTLRHTLEAAGYQITSTTRAHAIAAYAPRLQLVTRRNGV